MRYILFLFIISAGFASCSEDFFSQTLDIDPPEYEKQFVVHGFGTNRDSSFQLALTQNYGILENVPDSAWAVPGATVVIFEDGQLKATLGISPDNQKVYEALVLPDFFQPGKIYELKASHPDFPTVTSRQTMPQPVAVDSVRFRENAGIDGDGSRLSAMDVYLKDEAGVENFYEIRMAIFYPILEFTYDSLGNTIIDTIGYQNFALAAVDSDDPNAELTYGGGIAIRDRFFDGQSYKFAARMEEISGYTYRVYVRAITEEYYLWGVSAERKYQTDDFPLAEPVTTYTNLDHGIGVFGLAHEQAFDVE
ncbi:MAG: DUF4249 domain-containing protein [Haliscomenobacteraceae bacterium CHB4]|nr:DUF4249 domain-containing protein [Haliscomenobacteraceae bacterium CHB4]